MMKGNGNKMNKMKPVNSKYNAAQSTAEHTATDMEFGQEMAGMSGTASSSQAASVTGTNKGIVQKVQKSEQ